MRKIVASVVLLLSMAACRAAGQTVITPVGSAKVKISSKALNTRVLVTTKMLYGAPKHSMPYIQFIGGRSDTKRMEYLQNLLKAVGVPSGVQQILVESPIGMRQARQMYNVPDNRPAFSSYRDGRVYIDDDTLDNPKMIYDYLLHEFGHFAANAYPQQGHEDNLTPEQIAVMEQAAEKGAQHYRDAYRLYRSPAGRAYKAELTRIASDSRKFQAAKPTSGTGGTLGD